MHPTRTDRALRLLAAVAAAAAMLTAVSRVAGANPALDPLAKLRRTDADLRLALNRRLPDWSPEAAVRQAQIDRLLRSLLDYDEIARQALGATFATLAPERRRAFVAAFSALTGQTFLARMASQQTRTTYEAETIDGGEARVTATACAPAAGHGAIAHVEYRLARKGDDWRITDVIVDGNSLVAGYERQFRRLVAREGVAGLMARMQQRLAAAVR